MPGLPSDITALAADTMMPGFKSVAGEVAATAGERRRIGAILAHPTSVGRFAAAVALAVEAGDPIPADAAAALLAALPVEQEKPRIPPLAERWAEAETAGAVFGATSPVETRAEQICRFVETRSPAGQQSDGAGCD